MKLQLVIVSFLTVALATPTTLEKRWCPRADLPAAKTLCETWFGKGNNQSRKCERLLQELAAQNCECSDKALVKYDQSVERVYCEPTGPCWY